MKRTKTIDCMVPFTEAELRALTTEVTRLFWQRAHLEEEKKETAKAFADQIADLSMEISEHMEELRLGGRLQPVVCVEEFNTPEPGKKTVTRTDTGAVIAEKEMSLDEINDMFVQHGNDEIPEGTEGTEGTEEAEAAGIELCDKCHTGGKLYHINNDKKVCSSCMLEMPQEKRVKELLNSGHAFRFRAAAWRRCGSGKTDCTNFRFIDDSPEARPADPWRTNGWGMGIWRPGSYLEEGTPANEFYKLLQVNPNAREG